MKLLITKTSVGVLDTDRERKRIASAFADQPEVQKKLTELIDAVEAFDWKLAEKLLASKWWQGRDPKQECHRAEFIGMINMKDPVSGEPATGFDIWTSYDQLVWVLSDPEYSKRYKVEEIKNG